MRNHSEKIAFEEARHIVMTEAVRQKEDKAALQNALGMVLAQDISCDADIPTRDISMVDGFACRRSDIAGLMHCVEIIPAGKMPVNRIGKGECARIMAGAVVPQGADTVILFKNAQEEKGVVKVLRENEHNNIRQRASDMRWGDTVLRAGKRILPADIALLANVGCVSVPVFHSPRIGIIAAGDELVEPGEKPGPAQHRDSNSPQLCARAVQMGCEARYFGIASDTIESVENAVQAAFNACEVVLFTGSVSVGDFDFVPEVLRRCQVDVRFRKVAVKPGKSTVFGTKRNRYFFGLPANPVAALVLFEVLIQPFLYKLMGHDYHPLTLHLKLEEPVQRVKSDCLEFRQVLFTNNNGVKKFDYRCSANMHENTQYRGILTIPVGVNCLEKGEIVEVMVL